MRLINSMRAYSSASVYYAERIKKIEHIQKVLTQARNNEPLVFRVEFPEVPGSMATTGPERNLLHEALSEALEVWHREHERRDVKDPPPACVIIRFERDDVCISPKDAAKIMRSEIGGDEESCPEEQFGWADTTVSDAEAQLFAEERRIDERMAKEAAQKKAPECAKPSEAEILHAMAALAA